MSGSPRVRDLPLFGPSVAAQQRVVSLERVVHEVTLRLALLGPLLNYLSLGQVRGH